MGLLKTRNYTKPTTDEYADHEVFSGGSLIRHIETHQLAILKANNDSECVIFSHKTYANKDRWRIKDLIGNDRRLIQMLQGLDIRCALPIQRYSWPKIHDTPFATLFISPSSTGKSYSHLLYSVSSCIKEVPLSITEQFLNENTGHRYEVNQLSDPHDHINHPKFIIICSSQDCVESISRIIELMKQKAYGHTANNAQRHHMAPVSQALNAHYDNEKLAARCFESEILITTPQTLTKCLILDYINFSRCKRVFFDDLDVVLQLQSNAVREIIKIYMIQNQLGADSALSTDQQAAESCQLHMFSRKWTELVKQFMCGVFTQRICLFGSLAEASIFSHMQFNVECYENPTDKNSRLLEIVTMMRNRNKREKVAIVCQTDVESRIIAVSLDKAEHTAELIVDENGFTKKTSRLSENSKNTIYIVSDQALGVEVEFFRAGRALNDIMHIIHFSLPSDPIMLDQRFRLAYKNIQDGMNSMTSTFFVSSDLDLIVAQQIYDIMSRSSTTLKATKLALRDIISSYRNNLCWRWATTGLCRLEKLSRDDRLGSYCLDRHSFNREPVEHSFRFTSGLVRATLTHIVSPSEFYFWLESYRSPKDSGWTKLEHSGIQYMEKLRSELDKFKFSGTQVVSLEEIKKGAVYGVFFPQEERVDRVLLLEEPWSMPHIDRTNSSLRLNKDLEYSKLVPVFRLDYGSRVEVLLKNLIALPSNLTQLRPQCHRGFHLGFRPSHGEPHWHYKSKKAFYEMVCANRNHDIYLWLRTRKDDCFWFENMQVSRCLSNIDSNDISTITPHMQLFKDNLADTISTEPPGLPASTRLETLCRWNYEKIKETAQYAFLRSDVFAPDVYILNVLSTGDVIVRQSSFKKQLDALESDLECDFKKGKLVKQKYFSSNVYCIARVKISEHCDSFNRVSIIRIIESKGDIKSHQSDEEEQIDVFCLDHGDSFVVGISDLYQATEEYIRRLPFQAIRKRLATISQNLFKESKLTLEVRNIIIDATRYENNDFKPAKCRITEDGSVYLYILNDVNTHYEPLSYSLAKMNIEMHENGRPEYMEPIKVETFEQNVTDDKRCIVRKLILALLRDIASEEFKSAKAKPDI